MRTLIICIIVIMSTMVSAQVNRSPESGLTKNLTTIVYDVEMSGENLKTLDLDPVVSFQNRTIGMWSPRYTLQEGSATSVMFINNPQLQLAGENLKLGSEYIGLGIGVGVLGGLVGGLLANDGNEVEGMYVAGISFAAAVFFNYLGLDMIKKAGIHLGAAQ